jgi:hypothetical protein
MLERLRGLLAVREFRLPGREFQIDADALGAQSRSFVPGLSNDQRFTVEQQAIDILIPGPPALPQVRSSAFPRRFAPRRFPPRP